MSLCCQIPPEIVNTAAIHSIAKKYRINRNNLSRPNTAQLSGLHVNDQAPNVRHRGVLRLTLCYNCESACNEESSCPRCGWQEDIAIDLTHGEHVRFKAMLRDNQQMTSTEAADRIISQRGPRR